ncbi:MAG TPA: response regulator [Alphaproteobacteria bacterium]|nr:response regulator [Alphaproteobacteria bacterium]
MDIVSQKNYQELLNFLPAIKAAAKEWQLVDIQLTQNFDKTLPADKAAEMAQALFHDREGKIYPCNETALCMLLHWGAEADPLQIPKRIEENFPAGSCKVVVHETTPAGLGKLQIMLSPPAGLGRRQLRRKNVVLVADDDMYMRLLVKKAVPPGTEVQEVADGGGVLAAYKQHFPDILFLDIHMPGRNGMDILTDVTLLDPAAHVVMLSADSSPMNVSSAIQQGARDFMAKPFTREKLNEALRKCPTFRLAR